MGGWPGVDGDFSSGGRIHPSRRKRWWVVTLDVPVFAGSPGRLIYTEAVKARHPQIALWKASRRFIEKMQWVLGNSHKSIGGVETAARLLDGELMQGGRLITQASSGVCVDLNPYVELRLRQSACDHNRVHRSLDVRSHSAYVKVEVCKDCGVRRTRGWYQEGEPWL